MLQMITNRSLSTKLKPLHQAESPPPRRYAAFPSPYGGECKQTGAPPPRRYAAFPSPYGGEWMALLTIVEQGLRALFSSTQRYVFLHPTLCLLAPNVMSSYIQRLFSFCVNIILIRVGCWRVGCWRMGHGGHHPTLICIPNNEAKHSRTGSPCPVLQQEARVFTPLSYGEGLGVGLLYIYAILRAFSETHQITVWKHGFQVVKPRVSGRENKGFANEGYHFWKV